MENYEVLWKSALEHLNTQLSSIFYDTFATDFAPVDIIGNKIILITNNIIYKNAVETQTAPKIRDALSKVNSDVVDFEIYVAKDKEEYYIKYGEKEVDSIDVHSSLINPKFTFESFVVGSSNEFIYSAAKAVAEQPGEAYNPLFIYGGTGLGKTHILMAIANYLKKYKPTLNVMYATCEQFVNQLLESISKGKAGSGANFRKKYRNLDVLLIDDVQFLSKKEATQTEFFHTFNELVLQNKQVVLASDRPPREIEFLEERLRTRFEGGLLADVQQPDIETRIAILKRKAQEQKCVIDIKVLAYMAENNESDIRSLIGKLTKVIFASKLHERPITIELVKDALRESTGGNQEELQAEDIITAVCDFYKVSKTDIVSKKKNKEISKPRQICMYLINEMMNLPLVTIGEKLGGRDHATVIYARNTIAEEVKSNSKLYTEINDIRKKLLKQ